MKSFLLNLLTAAILVLIPNINFGQAPDLGAASSFAVFTAVGAFSNIGDATVVTGDVGTNVGAFDAFPPGVLIGTIHVADPVSAQAATDVASAYAFLDGQTCGMVLTPLLGNGQILTPDTYCIGEAASINGDLILDAQGDPDALFIFQIDGALTTSTFSNVILVGGASICNVWWQVNGAFTLGDGSVFRGNLINNGAIHLLEASSLYGRALSQAGAIDLHNNVVTIGLPPTAAIITANGPITFCEGESVILSGNIDGTWSTGAITGSITVSTSGNFYVVNTTLCGNDTSNQIIVTVNPLPTCTITGDDTICEGESSQLCTSTGSSWLWSTGATTNCIAVSTTGAYSVTVTDANGCSSSCSFTVTVNPQPSCSITGDDSICEGESSQLCTTSGTSWIWSTGATTNCITVSAAGAYSVTVTDANGCTSSCSITVTVNPVPTCSITGNIFVCEAGQTTQLCVPSGFSSYLWSTGATTNCVTVSDGTYSVTITDANGCSSSCSVTVTVDSQPSCTITGDNSICEGESTQLCVPAGSSTYLWSTGATTNCITVSAAGTYSVTVTEANGCSSTCSAQVTVNLLPSCLITGDISICEGESSLLCASAGFSSYLWSTGATSVCIAVSAAGTYSVTVTDVNGCSSTCSIAVTVNLLPSCLITGDVLICEGQSTDLCTSAGFSSYTWSTGATTNCITVNTAGTYSVTVTDANGCSGSCSITVTISPGTLPIITCPADIVIECGENTLPANTGTATATGDCNDEPTVDYIDIIVDGTCPQEYTIIRIWTATDASGNTSSCAQNITIIDSTPPVIGCPVVVSPVECGSTPPTFGTPTAVDACDGSVDISFSDQTIPGSCPQEFSVTRTWTAIDDCGNSSQCSRTVVVQDNTAPVINCPVVVSPIECGTAPTFGTPTAIDACDGSVDISFSDQTIPGSCPQEFSVTRTWTAIDDCGNSSQCSRTVVVQDNTAPVINCPVVVSPLECGTAPTFGTPTAVDACDGSVDISFSDQTIPGSCPQEFSVTRTWTAIDDCGNSSQCSRTIVVEDNTAPVINCPVVVSPLECGTAPTFGTPTAIDACDGIVDISFSDETTPGSCPQEFSVTRTWTAIDDCGNSSQCSRTIVVEDNTAPVINCPVVVSPIACGTSPSFGIPTAIDACDGLVDIIFSDVTTPGLCPQEYSVTRTWTATDDCGNSSQCSRTVVVEDNTLPLISCPIVISPIECPATPSFGTPIALDACDVLVDIIFSDVTIPGSCPQEFSVTRTWTATDDCGNSSSCSRTIEVQDNIAPLITCPANITVQCGDLVPAVNTALVVTSDNCGIVTVLHVGDVISNQTCENDFILTRTYRATDACGNSSTCVQVITVFDNTVPVITFINQPFENGETFEIQCFGQDPEWDLPLFDESNINATDNCGGPVTLTFNQVLENEGDCKVDGYINLYRLTWTASDVCGNSSSAFVFMALVDTIPPVIYGVPGDISVNCNEIPEPPVLVYAIDECLCACVIFFEETEFAQGCQNGLVITRSWTAKDRCGNVTIATQNITLIDDEGPELQLLQTEILGLTDGAILEYTCNEGGIPSFFASLNAESVFSSGSCGGAASITFDNEVTVSNNCEFFGYVEQQTFTWVGVDLCGNSSTMTITARLMDNEAPVLTGVPDLACIGDPLLREVDATDNCGFPSVGFWDVIIPNPCGEGTALRRTYEANDGCGNVSRDTAILIPNDQIHPSMELVNQGLIESQGEVMILNCAFNGLQYTTFSVNDVSFQDACMAGVTVNFTENLISTGDCSDHGNIAVLELLWTATDVCGNLSEISLNANVIDESSPVFVDFIAGITIGCNDTLPEIQAIDNCGQALITTTESIITGDCEFEYVIERFVTVTDLCGNSATRMQAIQVGDGSGPLIEGVEEEICDDLTLPQVTAYDECADQRVEVTMQQDTLDVPCQDGLVIQRIWTAVDACGNVNELIQTIIMNDHTPPEILIPSYSVIRFFMENEHNLILLSQTDLIDKLNALNESSVIVSDGCDPAITPEFTVAVTFAADCDVEGYFEYRIYTWEATDACDNTITLSFDVFIMDDVPPVITNIPGDTMIICAPLPPVGVVQTQDLAQPVTIVVSETMEPGDEAGVFIVTRTWVATDACGNETIVEQNITWMPNALLDCPIILPEAVECNSHGVVIESSCTFDFPPVTYLWDIAGGDCFIQAGQGTPTLTIYIGFSSIVITLTTTDAFGCVSVTTTTLDCQETFQAFTAITPQIHPEMIPANFPPIIIPGSKNQPGDNLQDLNLWPNPATGNINISFESAVEEEVEFTFKNFLGQVISQDKVLAHKGFNKRLMDVSQFPVGSFLMQVTTRKELHAKVMVILRDK